MTHSRSAGVLRLLCAAALLLLFATPVRAAQMHWEKLADRERVTITMTESEGMAGPVGRVAPDGVLIPFNRVPAGLIQDTIPEGAEIFKGTRHFGQSVVLMTQTPAFGFVVSQPSPKSLSVDFFPNPLGARWRPSQVSPTTEVAPEFGLPELAPPDAAAQALAADPQGTGAATAALLPSSPAQPTGQPPAVQTPSPQAPMPGARGSAPAPAAPIPGATPDRPVVVALSGTPEYATAATQMAEPPDRNIPARSVPAQGAPAPGQPPPEQTAAPAPLLDTRSQTAELATPLPVPSPPVSFSVNDGTMPGAPQATQAPQPAYLAQTAPAGQVQPYYLPAQPAAGDYAAQAVQTQPYAQPLHPPPGVGVAVGTGVYGGDINISGLESLPQPGMPAPMPVQAPPPAPGSVGAWSQPVPADQIPQARTAPQPVPQQQMPPAPQSAAPAGAPPGTPEAVVVYTDDQGNPVAPPPDPLSLVPEIQAHIAAAEYAEALAKAEALLERGILENAQREDLLHTKAEMMFVVTNGDFSTSYNDISDATNTAINYNQKSPRNASALLRLGYMNLKMNNIPEAEARFSMLRHLYPEDENVPLSYYYWGDYHFGRGEMQKAADEFQYILQKYSNSKYAREAALGLARSFYRLGYYEESFNVVDYIERRWERFYVQYPPFLNMMGDVAFRLNKLDYALKHYWLYINLTPSGEEADIILTRVGDIYGMQQEKGAARELYNECLKRFPDKDGGLVALMRLAEEGVNDIPTIAGMFSIFDGPTNFAPVDAYRKIINDHSGSSLVPLAELKLALWHLWKKDYIETLDILSLFIKKYPKHELVPRAKEIAMQTFAVLAAESLQTERYGRMRDIWERYPILRDQGEVISPESRIALGVSYRFDGKPNEALQVVEPFFLGNKIPEYSEMALSLVLNLYLEHDQWQSIREVARRVDLWELTPESRLQLDYALALAAENLSDNEEAKKLWQKLYDSAQLSSADMAYASFFLARHAEKDRELEKAYFVGTEALSRLLQLVETNPNTADVGKIETQLASLMDVAETAGRLREALNFADQYLQYLSAEDPERNAVNYRIARIYKKQGDVDGWKKTLTAIVNKSPNSVYGQLAASELTAASLAEDAAKYSPTGNL